MQNKKNCTIRQKTADIMVEKLTLQHATQSVQSIVCAKPLMIWYAMLLLLQQCVVEWNTIEKISPWQVPHILAGVQKPISASEMLRELYFLDHIKSESLINSFSYRGNTKCTPSECIKNETEISLLQLLLEAFSCILPSLVQQSIRS